MTERGSERTCVVLRNNNILGKSKIFYDITKNLQVFSYRF